MNYLLFVLSIVLQYVVGVFFDFHWSQIAICTIIISLLGIYILRLNRKTILTIAFFSTCVLWGIYSLAIDNQNEGILYTRIAQLFNLPSKYLLIAIQAILGGLVALFSAFIVVILGKK